MMFPKIIVYLALFVFTGCSLSFTKSNEVVTIEPIIIGGILDMTGSAKDYGRVLKNVANLRIEQWNEAGGVHGGRSVEVEWENGNCNQRVAEYAANELITEKGVSIIWGGVCSDETIGAARVTEKKKVILISPTSSSSEITDLGDYIFRTIASSESQGAVLARHAFDKGYQKVGILIERTGYTKDLLNVFKKYYTGETIWLEVFPDSENMALDQIANLQSQNVDAIFIISQGSETAYKAVSRLAELGWEGGLIVDEVGVENPTIKIELKDYLLEREATGALYIIKTETTKMQEFQDEYLTRYGEELKYLNFAASMLDAVDVVMEGLEYVEEVDDTKAIANMLYSTQHVGYTGNISFDKNGDLRAEYSLVEFDGNVFSEVKK